MTTDPKDALPPRLDPACTCICHSQPGVMHVAPCCWEADPKDAEIARKALHKAEKEHCSNFDKGAVFHWAEKGAYVLKADAQAETARLTAALADSEAATEGALMILAQTQTDYVNLLRGFADLEVSYTQLEIERDAALAQVAAAITGNKSGTICRDCRGVGMIHCSDPFNCGGMQPYTVEELKSALSRRDAQMRAEGMRMAAGIARSIIDGRVYFNERARSDDEAFACAILAAAKREET